MIDHAQKDIGVRNFRNPFMNGQPGGRYGRSLMHDHPMLRRLIEWLSPFHNVVGDRQLGAPREDASAKTFSIMPASGRSLNEKPCGSGAATSKPAELEARVPSS
jgi:hypothetical protein